MPNKELTIGKRLNIGLIDNIETERLDADLLSYIDNVIDADELIISCPMYRNRNISLYVGEIIKVQFASEQGLFIFQAQVIEDVLENNISLYKIRRISQLMRIQRREHFRINTQIPLIYQKAIDGIEIYRQGIIRDISGGGLKFICKDNLEEKKYLNIFFTLGCSIEIRTTPKIVRIIKLDSDRYEVSVSFEELGDKEREALIKYIFNTQTENLKKKSDNTKIY